jgi:hypothetical protein
MKLQIAAAVCVAAAAAVVAGLALQRRAATRHAVAQAPAPAKAAPRTSNAAGTRSAPTQARGTEGPVVVRVYAVRPQPSLDADAYRMLLATDERRLADTRREVERLAERTAEDALYVVLERGARRWCIAAREFASGAHTVLEEARSDCEREFSIEEIGTQRAIAALLVDEAGRPYGPVAQIRQKISLPADWRGYALAAGYVPAPLWLNERAGHAFLRRAAWASGRVCGALFENGKLWFSHLEADSRGLAQPADAVDVGADGSFTIGPIPAGEKSLLLQSETAWLSSASRRVHLQPGRQDLGVLIADPLHALCLRIERETGEEYSGAAYVWVDLTARGLPGFAAKEHTIADGRLTLPRFRADALDVWVWTPDGRLASALAVFAEHTCARTPLTLRLQAPGAVVAHITVAPFELPAGCRLLAYPNAFYRERHALLRSADDRPQERVRSLPAPPGRSVRIERLWPGPTGIALVAPSGTVLAERSIDVPAGRATHETIEPSTALAALDVDSAAGDSRFAIVSDAGGIVLRGHATALARRYLLGAGTYRVQILDPHAARASAALTLAAGEVRALRLD